MFRTIERGPASIHMVTGMLNCWSVLVIAFNISSGDFKMRAWWTAAPHADYSKTLPQYNPRKYFQFPFILWRIQLGNSLWPQASCPNPLELCVWVRVGVLGGPEALCTPWLCVLVGSLGDGGWISLPLAAPRAFLRSTLRVSDGVLLQLLWQSMLKCQRSSLHRSQTQLPPTFS